MTATEPTFVGRVASVAGGILRVRLRKDIPTTLVLVEGSSYRIGQVGGFFRVPMGYTQLYAVCTQVGADAAPAQHQLPPDSEPDDQLSGYRWMTMALFGEAVAARFERGVGQYPTVGDEVHFVTQTDLDVIYGQEAATGTLTVGNVAASNAIPARLLLNNLISRHCAVIGSTGSGKSNLVAILLQALSTANFPSARTLVIDPHGEYGAVAGDPADVFRINPGKGEGNLRVPFWALPFDELLAITFGAMSPANESAFRDRVQELKREASVHLKSPPPLHAITADSPIPFSIKKLWFEFDDYERQTFRTVGGIKTLTELATKGDLEKLESNIYEPYQPGSKEPLKQPTPRSIGKQLELARSRLTDPNYGFLFDPGGGLTPDKDGKISSDLAELVAQWVGRDRPLTVLDVSELPSDVAVNVVGLLVRVIYDTLFWAGKLPISGRMQPLLIALDEAHRFLPEGADTSAQRILRRIAKEGRKYGVGLLVISQRPSELDSTVLSQCGTMVALRTTNEKDRGAVRSAFPDDLGGLVDLLPSLRTGEGLFVGEAMQIPTRVRVTKSARSVAGSDPDTTSRWREKRPAQDHYEKAIQHWRKQSKE